jgi:hypothetical protein
MIAALTLAIGQSGCRAISRVASAVTRGTAKLEPELVRRRPSKSTTG